MVKAIVIADDLTGAGDTGLSFRREGLSVRVSFAARVGRNRAESDVLVLSTETRNRSESEAGGSLRRLAKSVSGVFERHAPGNAPPLVYKKIDSTLRGWVGTEIKALLDHVPLPAAWVVPAYPKQGRRLEGGVYTVHGAPLHETEFAKEICPVPADSRIQPLLEKQMGEPVGFVGCDTLAEGPEAILERVRHARQGARRVVLFDAATDDHLRQIVEAGVRSPSPLLWVGSAGLAHPLAARLKQRERGGGGWSPVVVVAGSRNPVSLGQVAFLKERVPLRHLTLRPGDPAPPDLEGVRDTPPQPGYLVTFPPAPAVSAAGGASFRLSLAGRLGELAARVIARSGSTRLVLTGGDIAAATCGRLGVEALQIVGQVEEGMPLLRACGGRADGALVVTKAGGFGSEGSLYRAYGALAEGEGAA